ncbi:MAG TPA: TolC family protein [Vicinamibacterales bacterium]|nr:TolC family protein [Vicinamibacterales bacterium]
MKSVHVAALIGVLVSAPYRAEGQTHAPSGALPLTLDDAVRRGLDTSHRIAEAVARGEAAGAIVTERHAALLPQVSAQAGYMRTNHVTPFAVFALSTNQLQIIYPDVPNNYRTRLDLQWPIYTGGRLDAIERAARIEATASDDEIAAARSDLTLEITRAYWALVTANESLHVVDESVRRIGAHLQDVRNQLAAGLVPPSDVSSVEAQASRQQMFAIKARGTRDVAEAELARLAGLAPGTSIDPVVTLTPPPVDPSTQGNPGSPGSPGSIDALVEAAKQKRPERAGLTKRVRAAEERSRAAAAGTKPTVAIAGGFDYARPNPRIFPREDAWKTSWDASVNVNWPLFDGGRTEGETAEAAASARAARERLAEFDAALALEIRQRLTDLTSARAAIAAAADAVRSAAEARRVIGERFNAGVATSTDVLDAQVALLQAELDRTQAVASARLAEARLARARGR